ALTGTATSNTSSSRSAPRSPGFRDEPFILVPCMTPIARKTHMHGAACRNETHSPVNNLSSLSNNRFPSSNIAKSPSGRALTAGFSSYCQAIPGRFETQDAKVTAGCKSVKD
ncbi:hypothetical protein, partial [Burkholderia pseudomallei]|uniref:hypothetical protein n=2 Tax=Burkholderia pseudomallei TaxID=28450 RepID=UPI001C4B6BBD